MRPLVLSLSLALTFACTPPALPRPESAAEYLRRARLALADGDAKEAWSLADRAAALAPRDARAYLVRGLCREALGEHRAACADFTRCIELDPKNAEAYDRRGSEQFKRGRIAESLADFDRALALRPEAGPGHWKRGISLYYAGHFDEGRRQFEAYQRVDANDVENAVWHFLCAARTQGVERARASLPKVGRDARVPLMQVYDLYRGRLRPADVLAAAEQVRGTRRQAALFYAHLYLGLYHDVTGDRGRAREHLSLAAGPYRVPHYMGDVARLHLRRLRGE